MSECTACQSLLSEVNQKNQLRTCVLKVDGKVVTIQSGPRPEDKKLCAIDCQASKQKDYKVHIYERINEKRQMALHFPKKNQNNGYFWIKVVENKLLVEETSNEKSPEQISDDYWFEIRNIGGGKKYMLCPLVSPSVWLALGRVNPRSFLLTEHSQESVLISSEPV